MAHSRPSLVPHLATQAYRVAHQTSALDHPLLQDSPSFEHALEHAAIAMAAETPHGLKLMANRACCRLFGYEEEEFLLLEPSQLMHEQDLEQHLAQRERMLAGDAEQCDSEVRCLRSDGGSFWAHLHCALVRDAMGEPDYFVIQLLNIDGRKRGEQALRESEERYRGLTALACDWCWEQDEQYRFVAITGDPWYKDLRPLLGKCRWELPGARADTMSWDEHRALVYAHQPFRNFEYACRGPDGSIHFVSASGEPVFDTEGRFKGYRGTTREITPAKLAESRLHDAQLLLHMAAQMGRLGAWALDMPELKLHWSEEVCAIHDVLQGFEPTLERALQFFPPEYQVQMQGVFDACLRDGSPFDVEAQIVTARQRRVWVRVLGEAQWDEHGRVVRLQGAVQDISESKRSAEQVRQLAARLSHALESLEERVRQRTAELESANKELEAFSYSLAHDLRAPLSAIDGFSQMLQNESTAADPARRMHWLTRIRASVKQMGELTEALLSLARLSRASLHHQPVDLSALAHAALEARREHQPGRKVEMRVQEGMRVLGDAALLERVMENLVANAWKFTGRQPHPLIEVGSRPGDDGQSVYYVRDNGAGFDMVHAGRLFEAFERLHSQREFEGTGIGLATVHKIITRHGGRIWAEAEEGEGACFFFTLGPGRT